MSDLSERMAALEERARRSDADIARYVAVRDLESLLCAHEICAFRRYGPVWIYSMQTLNDLMGDSTR